MIRANDIQEKLLHLIGWEQNYDTSDLKISDALTISESGLYFQQKRYNAYQARTFDGGKQRCGNKIAIVHLTQLGG